MALDAKQVRNRMIIGWLIGLTVISFFIFGIPDPDPEWGTYWRVRPLIITPLAAAFGMLSFFLQDIVKPANNLIKVVVFLVSLLGFIVALWLGIVLGLDGTMWT